MNSAHWRPPALARAAGPLLIILIFLFCSTFGLGVGQLMRVDHPGITALPVYPNVLTVRALSPGRVGSLSTPTITPIAMPTLLTNFVFETTDSGEAVLAYYRQIMENEYGMQVVGDGARDPRLNNTVGISALRYGRAARYDNWTVGDKIVPMVWVVETVTITVDERTPGVTRATVYFDIRPWDLK